MRLAARKDEFAEVAVGCDQDSAIALRDGENLLVRQTRRVVSADPGCVVAKALEMGSEPGIGALVEDKPHDRAAVGETVALRRGRVGLAATAAWA